MKKGKYALLLMAALIVSALVPASAFAAVSGALSPGWVIYTAGQYRYGPSIIINGDGSADMWTCAPGSGGAWDFVYYRHSTDGGSTWSSDSVAVQPTSGGRDHYSACDPGVVKFGGYYYMGYTSTEDSRGTDNDVYVARATSASGPWEKWNGSGWGGNPQPFIVYDDPYTDAYGAGEPSLVVKGTTLYIYYTWLTKNASGDSIEQTRVRTASTTNANWPGSTTYQGVAINRVANDGEDSTDHKYIPAIDKFIAFGTAQRFTPGGYVKIYESADGITYTLSSIITGGLETKIHNMGISGDESGHYNAAQNNFIAYAYGDVWGQWNTYLNPISLSTSGLAGSPTASSQISGWSVSRIADGNSTTNWSSNGHGSAASTEWVSLDLGSVKTVSGITLAPRSGGYCFPVDFKLQYSGDAATWTDVPGQSYTSYANPGSTAQTFNFGSSVTARYVRLYMTKLSPDDFGNYYAQLAEFSVSGTSAGPTNLFANSGFETPAVGDFQYAPFSSGFNFLNGGGVQKNGGSFGAATAPGGSQTAFLQNDSEFNQIVSFTAGSHTVHFSAAKRSTGGTQTVKVYYDSTLIGTFTPSSTAFSSFATSSFTATAGYHTIRFVGTNKTGDNTDFIDNVTIS